MRKFCINHPTQKAFRLCHFCGDYYCEECLIKWKDYYYCRNIGCLQAFKVENGLHDHDTSVSKIIIGIDFGTTKTTAAILRDNRIEIIPDSKGRMSIPSVVLISPENEIFIGWDALNHPNRYLNNYITINSILQILGNEEYCNLGSRKVYPHLIIALILRQLKLKAEAYIGDDINEAVISVPAHFNINQREALKQASEIAGFKIRRIISAATLAAQFCTFNISGESNNIAMVVDVGGDNTNASIMAYGDGVFEVKSVTGQNNLGGNVFDDVICDHVQTILRNQFGNFNTFNQLQNFAFRNAITNAKIELSESLSSRIYLPSFIGIGESTFKDLDYTLTRDQLNKLIAPYLNRVVSIIDESLVNASVTLQDINRLYLIGGSSRIPKIKETISLHLRLQPESTYEPEFSVVKGSAIQAGVLSGTVKDVLLLNVFPGSLSILLDDGSSHILIEKSTTIPTLVKKIFSTTYNNQRDIIFRIFENNNWDAPIGELLISNIPPAPKGIPQIEIILDIDANNIIHVAAKDKSTGQDTSLRISSSNRLSNEQVSNMHNSLLEIMKSSQYKL